LSAIEIPLTVFNQRGIDAAYSSIGCILNLCAKSIPFLLIPLIGIIAVWRKFDVLEEIAIAREISTEEHKIYFSFVTF